MFQGTDRNHYLVAYLTRVFVGAITVIVGILHTLVHGLNSTAFRILASPSYGCPHSPFACKELVSEFTLRYIY